MSQLKVNFGNVYVGNRTTRRAINLLKQGAPDGIVINEGRKALRFAVKFSRKYRVHFARHATTKNLKKGRADVLVMVHKKHRYLGEYIEEVMRERQIQSWHTRYVVAALFQHKELGKQALIGAHPSPAPKVMAGNNANHPLIKEYVEFLDTLQRVVTHLRNSGYKVTVASDIQVRKGALTGKAWDPYGAMERVGLNLAVDEGIDAIWTDNKLAVQSKKVLASRNSSKTGSDHPFLQAIMSRRK